MPVLRGFSRNAKQDSVGNEVTGGERHKVPNVAWESKTILNSNEYFVFFK